MQEFTHEVKSHKERIFYGKRYNIPMNEMGKVLAEAYPRAGKKLLFSSSS
jgi:hypothetical protein